MSEECEKETINNLSEEEIKELIEELGYKEFYRYYEEKIKFIEDLQQKVEQLEKEKNTLMYSLTLVRQKWNNDKARYRRKAKVYREQRNQLENIRKEAIEYINKHSNSLIEYLDVFEIKELNNILNKGSDK